MLGIRDEICYSRHALLRWTMTNLTRNFALQATAEVIKHYEIHDNTGPGQVYRSFQD
jgi:hypothetical protein